MANTPEKMGASANDLENGLANGDQPSGGEDLDQIQLASSKKKVEAPDPYRLSKKFPSIRMDKDRNLSAQSVGSPDDIQHSKDVTGKDKTIVLKAKTGNPDIDSDALGDRDTVTWSSVEYLVKEGEEWAKVKVLRWGMLHTPVTIEYKLVNLNLMPEAFEEQSDQVVMAAGVPELEIKIKIIDNPYWNVEGMMDIQLSVFKGKADVGDLDCATIVVLNDDKFPMDIDIPPEDLLKTTNQLKMVYGFIEHNYHILKNEFWWCCAYKLVPALCWLVGNILMLDTLQVMELCQEGTPTPSKKTWSYVKGDDGDDYSGDCVAGSIMWVWILAVCYIINHGIAFTVDCSIGDLKLGGKATRALRTDIFAVMLQFTPESNSKFDTGKVMKIMENQTEAAVKLTWLNVFTLVEKIFTFIVVSSYVIYLGATSEDGGFVLYFLLGAPFVVMVGQAAVFFWCKDTIIQQNIKTMHLDDEWSSFVVERANIRPLITNYRCGYKEADKFEKIHKAYNEMWAEADGYWGVVQWRVATVAEVIAMFFLGIGGMSVVNGSLNIGAFVTALGSISTFGSTTASIFGAIFDLMKGYASVFEISDIFNTMTRRSELFRARERRLNLMAQWSKEKQEETEEADLLKKSAEVIQLHKVVFAHDAKYQDEADKNTHKNKINIDGTDEEPSHLSASEFAPFAVPRVTATIEAGSVIALVGEGSSGKTTLLRLLARQHIPSSGWISYPEYWRVRYLDAIDPPYFFKGTMKANLKFGNQHEHTDKEITELLQNLGVSDKVCDNMSDMIVTVHGTNLSLTDATLCSIARAILSSVDLLLISNLMDVLGEDAADTVMDVFKDMVRDRSMLCLASENAAAGGFHKPKTVILSTKKTKLEDKCDYKVSMSAILAPAE